MNDAGDASGGQTLSALLDLQVDSEPISGRLRTEWGADERFVGWLGFVGALKRLSEQQLQVHRHTAAERPHHRKESTQ